MMRLSKLEQLAKLLEEFERHETDRHREMVARKHQGSSTTTGMDEAFSEAIEHLRYVRGWVDAL